MWSASDINLQTTLVAGNPPSVSDPPVSPHHPLTCRSELLWLEEDGRLGCEHAQVPPGDPRTQGCIDHSVAILLIELAVQREGVLDAG